MREYKDSHRAHVRVIFDGRVVKTFRGRDADTRFANEVRVLRALEFRCCPYVPRLLSSDASRLEIVTTNCGQVVERLSSRKLELLFGELEEEYGVRHDDPFARNVTYRTKDARFCLIDFELAEIVAPAKKREEVS